MTRSAAALAGVESTDTEVWATRVLNSLAAQAPCQQGQPSRKLGARRLSNDSIARALLALDSERPASAANFSSTDRCLDDSARRLSSADAEVPACGLRKPSPSSSAPGSRAVSAALRCRSNVPALAFGQVHMGYESDGGVDQDDGDTIFADTGVSGELGNDMGRLTSAHSDSLDPYGSHSFFMEAQNSRPVGPSVKESVDDPLDFWNGAVPSRSTTKSVGVPTYVANVAGMVPFPAPAARAPVDRQSRSSASRCSSAPGISYVPQTQDFSMRLPSVNSQADLPSRGCGVPKQQWLLQKRHHGNKQVVNVHKHFHHHIHLFSQSSVGGFGSAVGPIATTSQRSLRSLQIC